MLMKLRLVFLVLVGALLWSVRAAAGSDDVSLGGWAASADIIVRGVVTNVQAIRIDPTRTNSLAWWKVTIDVHETLRGPPLKTVVTLGGMQHDPVWAHLPAEQIFFLVSTNISYPDARAANGSGKSTFDWRVSHSPGEAIDLDALEYIGHRGFVADDLRVLHKRDDIIAEIRRVAAVRCTGMCKILLPKEMQNQLGIDVEGQGDSWLEIPLTEDTVAEARLWLASSDMQLRWCGAEVLFNQNAAVDTNGFFKLAGDTPLALEDYGDPARARILVLLRKRGVEPPPLVQSSVALFDPSSPGAWLSIAGVLFLPAVYWGWKRLRRRRLSIIALVWIGAMGLMAVLAIRSFSPRDALSYGNYDLALENGVLYVNHHRRADIGLPSPWVMCCPTDLLRYQSAEKWNLARQVLRNDSDDMDSRSEDRSSFLDLYAAIKAIAPPPAPGLIGTIKARMAGPCWAIPAWFILALMLVPVAFIWTLRLWRWFRNRIRPRGFPVELKSPQVSVPQ